MNDDVKIRIMVTKGTLVLAELHSVVDGGRHEFVFAEPISARGRHFGGFALECWLDQSPRLVHYREVPASPLLLR